MACKLNNGQARQATQVIESNRTTTVELLVSNRKRGETLGSQIDSNGIQMALVTTDTVIIEMWSTTMTMIAADEMQT